MTRNEQYWIDRANRRMDGYQISAIKQAKIINRSYNQTCNYVQSEIAKILRHIGDEDSLAYEYRMKRLNALLAKTQKKMQELYGVTLNDTTEFLRNIIPEAYYHTIFDIAQAVGEQPVFSAVNTRLIDQIVNDQWSGKNYSQRIWWNTSKLSEDVQQLLTTAAMSGESIYKTSRRLSERFGESMNNSVRLIRTETTYSCNQAELASYEELDIDRYKYVATLDTRTSPICQKLDGQIFNTKDAKAGVNLPAMHPNCRSTTIPYFKEGRPQFRTARDKDGKRIKVPADMKYDEWYKKYIEPYEGEKGIKKRTKPSKGKDTTPSRTTPQQPQEVPTIDVPAPSVGIPEYVEEKIPEKPLSIFEEAEQNRDKINAALHDVEEKRRSLDHEVGTIIDRQGNIINVTDGEEHSVSPPEDLLKDNIFTHNHPSGGIFSAGDLEAMIGDELLELRASTPQGTYYSLKRIGAVPKDMEFMEEYKKNCSFIKASEAVAADLRSGKLTRAQEKEKGFNLYTEYMAKLGDDFLTQNAEKYGYIYTKGVI